MDRKINRRSDKQTQGKQNDGQTNMQTGRQIEEWTRKQRGNGRMDRQTDRKKKNSDQGRQYSRVVNPMLLLTVKTTLNTLKANT